MDRGELFDALVALDVAFVERAPAGHVTGTRTGGHMPTGSGAFTLADHAEAHGKMRLWDNVADIVDKGARHKP